jgi:hypothetical protein
VTNAQIAANAVTGVNVADGSLTSADLLDGPRTAVATANGVAIVSNTVIASVTVAAPAAGRVLASTSYTYSGSPAGTLRRFNCGLTTGTVLPTQINVMFVDYSEIQGTTGGINSFIVGAAGNVTVNLVCTDFVGDTTLFAVHLHAMYVAQ